MITMYGIKNCDTIKKARNWLDNERVAYGFHDYKVAGVDKAKLEEWVMEHGWETILNRSGTTFKALDAGDKAHIDADKAILLMITNPSMIKRPILDTGKGTIVGFKATTYEEALQGVKA
ncbi:MAG TPA: ArsC family reductase [Sphingobium sp.]|jgi:arsenate reductase|uniref:ArsC family reductase n=1 Tax=unclassified Sphingobium TaxID=2611147 RepID=UPI0007F42630|nr:MULTISPECIES: ArsC family reductase [unclassified Sphingobium]OAN51784.1 arsenate reductase [Sphingobium sp. TCM1]WIW88476.1 ArsC family reductase [Sphingobium sp. V4]HAF42068.1 ArsC family reductase [Sphingobium sp.]